MSRIAVSLAVTLAIATTLCSQSQPYKKPAAPTYYIAANAEYRDSQKIWLRGSSNLPAGAVLVAEVLNYVGEGSQTLSVRALPRVGKDGFFGGRTRRVIRVQVTEVGTGLLMPLIQHFGQRG